MVKDFSENALKSELSKLSVLVVGGVGFIGHNLALKLAKYGAKVTILDNLMVNSLVDNSFDTSDDLLKTTLNQHFLYDRLHLLKKANVALVNGDARLSDDLRNVMEISKPDKIVHLAAIASAVEARKNPSLMFDLQLLSLRNILELTRSKYFDFVQQVMLLSSSTVYGDFKTDIVDENMRPRPKGIYANTKFMAERLARTYAHQYGIGSIIIRPSALYGERCVSR
ncbi:MAG: NAD(P)-dependent oxidoreductase [Pseudomonadota bacterium]